MKSAILPLLLTGFILSLGADVFAQGTSRTPVKLGKVKYRSVETPQYAVRVDGSGGQQRARNDWLEAVCEFETAPEWVDELSFNFYVMLKGDAKDLPQGSAELNNFAGEVTYVHLPKDNKHRASMYIEPHVFERYGDVKAVAVEVKFRGQVVGQEISTDSPRSKWWQDPKYPPIRGNLLNKSQTPFIFVDYDDHPMLKPKAAAQ